ncbi:hypothetical protein FH972_023267 [Carpinus fangiana]|uniref:PXA domain-containing protein n=1 Tax=Carpinus fangiana TaxID=176857 RepID=A0A5N6KUY4_9ROSI|nr:hypothetical protein FH972_023267 [Carpinus fangiana]
MAREGGRRVEVPWPTCARTPTVPPDLLDAGCRQAQAGRQMRGGARAAAHCATPWLLAGVHERAAAPAGLQAGGAICKARQEQGSARASNGVRGSLILGLNRSSGWIGEGESAARGPACSYPGGLEASAGSPRTPPTTPSTSTPVCPARPSRKRPAGHEATGQPDSCCSLMSVMTTPDDAPLRQDVILPNTRFVMVDKGWQRARKQSYTELPAPAPAASSRQPRRAGPGSSNQPPTPPESVSPPGSSAASASSKRSRKQQQQQQQQTKAAAPKLQFINASQPYHNRDPNVRMLVRSHVMKGVKREEKIARTSAEKSKAAKKPNTARPNPPTSTSSSTSIDTLAIDDDVEPTPTPSPPLALAKGSSMSLYGATPISARPESHRLLYYYRSVIGNAVYPFPSSLSFNPVETSWIPCALSDEVFFKTLMFSSASHLAFMSGGGKESTLPKVILQSVFRQLGDRLGERKNLSDATIGAVTCLAMVENMRGNFGNYQLHMTGLRDIIEQRGLADIEGQMQLKVYRTEVEGAVNFLSRPILPPYARVHLPLEDTTPLEFAPRLNTEDLQRLLVANGVCSQLVQTLCNIARFARSLEYVLSDRLRLMVPNSYDEDLVCLQLQLLVIAVGDEVGLTRAMRLGGMLFVKSTSRGVGVAPPSSRKLLKNLKDSLLVLHPEQKAAPLLLWLTFVGGAGSLGQPEHTWFVERLRMITTHVPGLQAWEDVLQCLRSILFVESIHRGPCQSLWEEMRGRLCTYEQRQNEISSHQLAPVPSESCVPIGLTIAPQKDSGEDTLQSLSALDTNAKLTDRPKPLAGTTSAFTFQLVAAIRGIAVSLPPATSALSTCEPSATSKASSTPPDAQPTSVSIQTKDGSDLPTLLRAATDRALTFLSNADNGTLGACLVGLSATTYVVLGRFGLVLIGVVGGVVLHATWEGSNGDAKIEESNRKREAGIEVARRLLDWRLTKSSEGAASPSDSDDAQEKTTDFSSFQPETAVALNSLTDAIVRDYVNWWYSPILPADLAFPAACRQTLASFISSLSVNLSRKRPADTFLEFTTNSSSVIIVILNELTTALSASPGSSAENALQTYLRLKPQSNLANILDEKHQSRKLKMVADDILENYLESNVYRCSPNRIFLREILANVILEMTIQTCSHAEWINEWIVYLLEDGEPELMREIDAGVEGVTPQGLGLKKEVRIEGGARLEENSSKPTGDHKRRVSRAEEAMDEAMREAQRLTQMIVEEEERKAREDKEQQEKEQSEKGQREKEPQEDIQNARSQTNLSEASDSTNNNHNVHTPTSSQSDASGELPRKASPQLPSRPLSSATPDLQHSPTQELSPQTQYQPLATQSVTAQSLPVVDELEPLASSSPVPLDEPAKAREPLTLRDAKISILDDLLQGDKRPLKSKPTTDYLIQIEPVSTSFTGWMISRTYSDFEVLHEVLRRISNISGCQFTNGHAEMPAWKGISKAYLKDELERYLTDAVKYVPLAESEGMKRFLERDRGLAKTPPNKMGFWPNPANVGKGMLDVLSKAPKEVAGSSKALFGNVQTAFGANQNSSRNSPSLSHPNRGASMSNTDLKDPSTLATQQRYSMTQDALRRPQSGGSPRPSMDSRSSSFLKDNPAVPLARHSSQSRQGSVAGDSLMHKLDLSLATVDQPRRRSETPEMTLPPRPDQISDDYNFASPKSATSTSLGIPEHVSHMSVDGTSFFEVPTHSPNASPNPASSPIERTPRVVKARQSPGKPSPSKQRPQRVKQPLVEQEAQVTVELLFAVISELYQLSSAWNIRRTLLTAAKTFLLRPGNPQLESIRVLLQESVLDANTSDSGIAGHINKLRENSMPTDEERAKWPAEKTDKEKEELRQKARKLLVQRGMPQALTSVMGAAASGEALGKVFDCLQVKEVARGVMFGLMLQLVRAVTQ